MGLALGVGLLHACLLLVELSLGHDGRDAGLTGASVAWWWGAAAYQLLRGRRIRQVEKRCVLGGHVVALTLVGLLSGIPGEPWACSMGLVALPLASALTQSRSTVLALLLVCSLGGAAVVLAHTEPLALGVYCSVAVVVTTLLPTLLFLHLRDALQGARDEALALAVTDPLTGLLNRRGMAQGFPGVRRAAPGGHRVAAVVLDLDHFKDVNDRHGHDAGDAVLARVAGVLRARARAGDLVVRLGGEELAWLGSWPTSASAVAGAEQLRVAVATSTGQGGVPVTTSIGVAFSTDATHAAADGDALSRLLVRADAALYEAKRAGRDCVRLAPSALPDGTDPHHDGPHRDGAPVPRARDGGSEVGPAARAAGAPEDQRA